MKLLGYRPGAKLRRALRHVCYLWALDRARAAGDRCLELGILWTIRWGGKVEPRHRGEDTGRRGLDGDEIEYRCRRCGVRWWHVPFDKLLRRAYSRDWFDDFEKQEVPIHARLKELP